MHEKKRIRRPKDQERPFRKSKKPRYHGLMVRKELSQEVQALVIFLRFGSINSDEREMAVPPPRSSGGQVSS